MPVPLLVMTLATAACAGDPPNMLDPISPDAERVGRLWWVMLSISGLVFAVVLWLLVGSILRRKREAPRRTDDGIGKRLIIWGGLIGPAVILVGVFLLATLDLRALSDNEDPVLDVVVSGEQWWWRVTYPEAGVETANEIHVPAGEEIRLVLETADVIHSFWIPQAGPKRDMIPGRSQELVLSFAEPGTYRGVCAEFCGLQHARMQMLVVAHPPEEFEAWLEGQAQPAVEPTGAQQERGRALFLESQCVGCHTIRGVSEAGTEGPDLTHLASRTTIAAATFDLTHDNLLAWIENPDHLKPGVKMPPSELGPDGLQALVAYLESLE